MGKLRLALLSGGVSSEREVSLNSGGQVYEALDKNRYEITRYDPKTDLLRLVSDAPEIDAALIILHGPFGEDGTIQGLLDLLDIPYQGAGVLGSSLAMNKLAAKQIYEQNRIPTPPYLSFSDPAALKADLVADQLGTPVVVKPVCAGSSVGMSLVRDIKDIESALALAFENDASVMVEQYVRGIELTCGVLGNDEPKALPVIEITPGDGHEFFDYKAKYMAGETREICPARIDKLLTRKVQELAVRAHKALFLEGYSRTDFIFDGHDLFVLETNTIPGMTATSLYPQAAIAAGYSFSGLLDRLITLAVDARKKSRQRAAG